MIIVIFMLYAC